MSTGRQTLASIEASIEDLQRQERALQAELEAGNKQRAGLVETRLGTIRELAEVRTRTAVSDGVIDDSDRLIASVRSLLEAREKTRTQLNQRHAEIDTRRNAARSHVAPGRLRQRHPNGRLHGHTRT